MKKLLILLITAFTAFGCNDKPTSLTLNFKAVYDNAELLIDEITEYTYHDGTTIKVSGLRFFISDVKLYTGSEAIQIIEVEDIDFTTNNKTCDGAKDGQSIIINDPIPGTYDNIEFSIGVRADLNATNPIDYGYDHPLGPSNSSEYWDAWDSFIFAKVEGRQDVDKNGEFDSFTYHTGMDDIYRTRTITQKITVTENKDNTIQFEIDAKQIFSNGTQTIDIVGDPVVHTLPTKPTTMVFSGMISDNLINAISIR